MISSIQGHPYKVTISHFVQYMRLHRDEFTNFLAFRALLYKQAANADYGVYWIDLTSRRNYDSSLSKASHFRNWALRLIHWLLVRSVIGKSDSQGVVPIDDLYFSHNMNRKRLISLAIAFMQLDIR